MKEDIVSIIKIPIKKEYFTELNGESMNICSKDLTTSNIKYLSKETISNLQFLQNYIESLINRLEGMKEDTSNLYIAITCKDCDNVLNYIERIDYIFSLLKNHVGYESQ